MFKYSKFTQCYSFDFQWKLNWNFLDIILNQYSFPWLRRLFWMISIEVYIMLLSSTIWKSMEFILSVKVFHLKRTSFDPKQWWNLKFIMKVKSNSEHRHQDQNRCDLKVGHSKILTKLIIQINDLRFHCVIVKWNLVALCFGGLFAMK